jgi:hypothetical protein
MQHWPHLALLLFSPSRSIRSSRASARRWCLLKVKHARVTWVVIEEVQSDDWGIGGAPLTMQDVKAMAAG